MPNTTYLTLPYPSLASAPNVPQDMQNLASGVDGKLGGLIICTSSTRPTGRDGALIFETDTDATMMHDGSSWKVYQPNFKYIRKTANTNRSSTTTLADDPDLVFSGLPANSEWHVQAWLRHQSPTAADLTWQWLGPTGAVFDHTILTITTTGAQFTDDNTYGWSIASPTTSGGLGSNQIPIVCEGVLTTSSTAGTFKLQWAQGTSNAGSSTLLANSFVVMRRLV